MMRDPLGVKLSVVTPVPNRLHLRVSFLFIAIPCKADYFTTHHMYDLQCNQSLLMEQAILYVGETFSGTQHFASMLFLSSSCTLMMGDKGNSMPCHKSHNSIPFEHPLMHS